MSDAPLVAGPDSFGGLFGGASSQLDRLPMLRVVIERAAAACSEELRGMSAVEPEITVEGMEVGTAAQKLNGYDGSGITGVLAAPGWNTNLLVTAERSAVLTIVEMVLGGDGSEPPYAGKRPLSNMETKLAALFFRALAKSLQGAFSSIAESTLTVENVAGDLDLEVIGGDDASIVMAKFRLEAMRRGGEVMIAIPQSALGPMRRALSQVPTKKIVPPPDPRWSEQIRHGVTRSAVVLSAVLDERQALLAEISDLKVGMVFELGATAQSRVRLECNGERLVWCQLGKSNGVYTLRVEEFVDQEQEFMNEILSG